MKMKAKFKVGERVVYNGLVGQIIDVSTYPDGRIGYGLESCEDSELTCTAPEHECEPYNGGEIDQSNSLTDAYFSTSIIQNKVANLKCGE